MNETVRLGNVYGDQFNTGYAGNVWDTDGLCPTLMTMMGGGRQPMIIENEEIKVGNIYGFTGGNYAGNVYDPDGLCPTINTMGGGNRQPMIVEEVGFMDNGTGKHQSNTVYSGDGLSPALTTLQGGTQQIKILEEKQIVAMRGRNPENPSDRRAGIETEQRLEPNGIGMSNTLTSVQKDNLVLETESVSSMVEKWIWKIKDQFYRIRIRKLTPRECWRLMGFSDQDFDKAASVNSNTQLYKQAGNSIVKDVLMAVFREMIPEGE